MGSLLGMALKPRAAAGGPPVPLGGSPMTRLPGLSMGSGQGEALLRSYGNVGTIFSIVSLYAESVARVPWQMFRQEDSDSNRYTTRDEGSDQRPQVMQHPFLSVLKRPMTVPGPNGRAVTVRTRQWLMQLSQTYLDLTGESYWVIEYAQGTSMPIGLWPVRPDRMEPVPDSKTYLKGYVYTSPDGRQRIPLMPNEVFAVLLPNPLDPYHGLGPVQGVLVDIDAARYSAEWNRNFFINSAVPGGVIQVDHALDDDEWNDLVNRWREAHRGVSRAHRVAVLEAGQTWVPNQHTVRDMDYGNLRGVARDVMREAFRMHKVMLGTSDDVNRANAQTGEEVFASWGIVPRLDRWQDAFNEQLLPLYGPVGDDVEMGYVTPVPPNREQDALELTSKSQAAYVLVQAGYEPSAVLQTVGLPDMPVAEKAVQAPALPPGWVPEAPAAPDSGTMPASAPFAAPGMPSMVNPTDALMQQMSAWNMLQGAT